MDSPSNLNPVEPGQSSTSRAHWNVNASISHTHEQHFSVSEYSLPTTIAPDILQLRHPNAYNRNESRRKVIHRYDLVPKTLLRLASSPMVRGTSHHFPSGFSAVTGNTAIVARARQLILDVTEKGNKLPEEWRECLELPVPTEEVDEWAVEDEGLVCPGCGFVI